MKNECANAMSNNQSLSDQENQISLIHLKSLYVFVGCKVANAEGFWYGNNARLTLVCTSAILKEIFQIFKFCTYDIVIQIGSNSFNYQSLVLYSSCYKKYRMFGDYLIK